LILCCLEGKTRDEAAQQLGCPEGTLKSRLERGRRLLQRRLARRGLTLPAGLLTTLLAPEGASAAVSGALLSLTVRASLGFGAAKLPYGSHGTIQRYEKVADANGQYALHLDPGKWFVWARRGTQGGQGPAWLEEIEIAAGLAPQPLTIRMEERGIVRGRLLEA